MDNHIFIKTKSGHSYVYSDAMRLFVFIPSELQKAIAETSDDAYYRQKAEFLKAHRFFDKKEVKFKCERLFPRTDYKESGKPTAVVD